MTQHDKIVVAWKTILLTHDVVLIPTGHNGEADLMFVRLQRKIISEDIP